MSKFFGDQHVLEVLEDDADIDLDSLTEVDWENLIDTDGVWAQIRYTHYLFKHLDENEKYCNSDNNEEEVKQVYASDYFSQEDIERSQKDYGLLGVDLVHMWES